MVQKIRTEVRSINAPVCEVRKGNFSSQISLMNDFGLWVGLRIKCLPWFLVVVRDCLRCINEYRQMEKA